MVLAISFVFFGFVLVLGTTKHFPSYIEKCHLSDPQVEICFRKALERTKSHFSEGIPEFGLPPMNPLIVPLISLDHGDSFKAWFENVEIYYLDELVKNINVRLEKSVININLRFPRLRIKSTYNIRGKIIFLQLNGNGPADGNFTDVLVKATLYGERYKKKGKEYFKFSNIEIEEDVHKPVFRFDGLFKNNPELTEQTNKIVNENIDDIIMELKPAVHIAVNQTVIGLVSYMFNKFSIDELFLK